MIYCSSNFQVLIVMMQQLQPFSKVVHLNLQHFGIIALFNSFFNVWHLLEAYPVYFGSQNAIDLVVEVL